MQAGRGRCAPMVPGAAHRVNQRRIGVDGREPGSSEGATSYKFEAPCGLLGRQPRARGGAAGPFG